MSEQFSLQSLIENICIIIGLIIVSYVARRFGINLHRQSAEIHTRVHELDKKLSNQGSQPSNNVSIQSPEVNSPDNKV